MATNHHDTGYKELFSYPEFVQQLVEGFAPTEIAQLMDFSTLKNRVFGVENAGHSWEALQQAVDRVVKIIEADPNKERVDRIITRWIKRHLSRLGAEVELERLNSLVEDRDMLAENLENLVKKERLEGAKAAQQEVARNLIARTEMNDQMIAEVAGLAVDEVSDMRSQVKH
jgi:hypothetical protein